MTTDRRGKPVTSDSMSTMNYDKVCFICSRCISLGKKYIEKRFVSTQTDLPDSNSISTQTDISASLESQSVSSISQPVVNPGTGTGDPYIVDLGPFSSMPVMVIPEIKDKQTPDIQELQAGTATRIAKTSSSWSSCHFPSISKTTELRSLELTSANIATCTDSILSNTDAASCSVADRPRVIPRTSSWSTSPPSNTKSGQISFTMRSRAGFEGSASSSADEHCDTVFTSSSEGQNLTVISVQSLARSTLSGDESSAESPGSQISIAEEACTSSSKADIDLDSNFTTGPVKSIVSLCTREVPHIPFLGDHTYTLPTTSSKAVARNPTKHATKGPESSSSGFEVIHTKIPFAEPSRFQGFEPNEHGRIEQVIFLTPIVDVSKLRRKDLPEDVFPETASDRGQILTLPDVQDKANDVDENLLSGYRNIEGTCDVHGDDDVCRPIKRLTKEQDVTMVTMVSHNSPEDAEIESLHSASSKSELSWMEQDMMLEFLTSVGEQGTTKTTIASESGASEGNHTVSSVSSFNKVLGDQELRTFVKKELTYTMADQMVNELSDRRNHPELNCALDSISNLNILPIYEELHSLPVGRDTSVDDTAMNLPSVSQISADTPGGRVTQEKAEESAETDAWANVLGVIDKIAAGHVTSPLAYGYQDAGHESASVIDKIAGQDPDQDVGSDTSNPVPEDCAQISTQVSTSQKKEKKHFQCIICEVKFRSKQYLGKHLKLHRDPDPYLCELCPARFVKYCHIVAHWENKHLDKKSDLCRSTSSKGSKKVVKKVMKSKKSKKASKQAGQFPPGGLWSCSRCGIGYKQKETFEKHEKLHSDSDPYTCGVCGTGFIQRYHLDIHSETHAPEDRNACFAHLGSVARGKSIRLQEVDTDEATDQVKHECGMCLKIYTNKESLGLHIKRMHTFQNNHMCEYCGKSFPTKVRLRQHIQQHTGEKPYECATCGRRCHTLGSLESHMFTHTGQRPYPCTTCGKAFKTAGALARHYLFHKRPFMCDTCGKTFARKCHLDDHVSTHMKVKPHVCSICGRGFSWKENLGAHMKLFHKNQEK